MNGKEPGIRERAKIAWDVFRRGFPRNAQRAGGFKAAALAWPELGDIKPTWAIKAAKLDATQVQWHIIDFESYVEEGFSLNSLIYSAVMYKWRALHAAPLRAWKGDRDHPEALDASHSLAKLVDRPNPRQSWRALQGQADIFLNVAGNAYFWLYDRPKKGGLPKAVYCPRPDRVFVVPGEEKDGRPTIKGYKYVPKGKTHAQGVSILPQDMMHVKLPYPLDPLNGLGEGMSPISPGARSANVDNNVTAFIKLFFERGGVPPYWFLFDVRLDDEIISNLQKMVQDIYGGIMGWVKPGVMGEGGKVERVGLTFEEMGFSSLDERNESRIVGPFGVPGILIGTRYGLQRSTFSNYGEARKAFWEDTMLPELGLFEDEYRYYLRTDDGAFVGFDYSKVPALQKDVPALVESAHKMWTMGVPANKAFEAVGLSVADLPAGDEGFVPLGMMSVGAASEAQPRSEEGAAEAEKETRE